jgi:hypothetical protein
LDAEANIKLLKNKIKNDENYYCLIDPQFKTNLEIVHFIKSVVNFLESTIIGVIGKGAS